MKIDEKNSLRLMYVALWLPVLLTPIAYMFLAYVGEGTYERKGLWTFVRFILPFCILFFIHHFLLVRKLFMYGKLKAYFFSVVVLLGLFLVADEVHFRKGMKRMPEVENMQHPPFIPPHEEGPVAPTPPKRPRLQHENVTRGNDAPMPVAMDFVIALLLIGANLSGALFLKYAKEKEHNANIEKERLKQELKYLKAQLNPHFFMNMLNNIHGMVEVNPEAAQEMLVEMSRLMRYVLYDSSKELIPLATETDFITTYVSLMRKRYSNKKISINLCMPVLEDVSGIMVPPLLFIVIVENAFKHGISYLKHSTFDMRMETLTSGIRFYSSNNRVEKDEAKKKACGGIGLANLRKRLELLYGKDYKMDIEENADNYTIILTIPYKYETVEMHRH